MERSEKKEENTSLDSPSLCIPPEESAVPLELPRTALCSRWIPMGAAAKSVSLSQFSEAPRESEREKNPLTARRREGSNLYILGRSEEKS